VLLDLVPAVLESDIAWKQGSSAASVLYSITYLTAYFLYSTLLHRGDNFSPRMPCQWEGVWTEGTEMAIGGFWLVSPFPPSQLEWPSDILGSELQMIHTALIDSLLGVSHNVLLLKGLCF
jgi:hypothetical protein